MIAARVCLQGCDDSTDFNLFVTEEELAFLHRLSHLSKEHSKYKCMPTLLIEQPKEGRDE